MKKKMIKHICKECGHVADCDTSHPVANFISLMSFGFIVLPFIIQPFCECGLGLGYGYWISWGVVLLTALSSAGANPTCTVCQAAHSMIKYDGPEGRNIEAKFAAKPHGAASAVSRIEELTKLKETGAITADEFEEKRKQILSSI